jgi:hypothetical protein
LGTPTLLFTRSPGAPGPFELTAAFDVTRDGKRFLLTRIAGSKALVHGPTIVQNWSAEFEQAASK